MIPSIILAYLSMMLLSLEVAQARTIQPIILVPGIFSSQLQVTVRRDSSYYYCVNTTKTVNLWFNTSMAIHAPGCLLRLISLPPPTGVTVTTNPELSSLEMLDHYSGLQANNSKMPYMLAVVRLLRAQGYANIHAAPYDFRRGVAYFERDFFPRLTTEIKRAAWRSGKRAIVVCHSMGCRLMLHYLQRQSRTFKRRYIARLVSISGAYGGSAIALEAVTLGYDMNMGVPARFLSLFKLIAQTYPAIYYLFPEERAFGRQTIVMTNGTRFEAGSMDLMLVRLGLARYVRYWRQSRRKVDMQRGPGVRVDCLYGTGVKTLGTVYLKGNFLGGTFSNRTRAGNGDGTVNIEGLAVCQRWKARHNEGFEVHVKTFEKAEHTGIMSEKKFQKYLKTSVFSGKTIGSW